MESKSPKIIEWPGLQHVEDNPELYLDMLLKDIVFVFRNANLGIDEQYELHRTLGETFNGFPNKTKGERDAYIEDHARLDKSASDDTGDDIRVPWHQEHFNYVNSIVYGNWNNEIFNIDKKNKIYVSYNGILQSYGLKIESIRNRKQENKKKITTYTYKLRNIDIINQYYKREHERQLAHPKIEAVLLDPDNLLANDEEEEKIFN